VHEEEE